MLLTTRPWWASTLIHVIPLLFFLTSSSHLCSHHRGTGGRRLCGQGRQRDDVSYRDHHLGDLLQVLDLPGGCHVPHCQPSGVRGRLQDYLHGAVPPDSQHLSGECVLANKNNCENYSKDDFILYKINLTFTTRKSSHRQLSDDFKVPLVRS